MIQTWNTFIWLSNSHGYNYKQLKYKENQKDKTLQIY